LRPPSRGRRPAFELRMGCFLKTAMRSSVFWRDADFFCREEFVDGAVC